MEYLLNIYAVINVVEFIALLTLEVFSFAIKGKTYSKVIQLVAVNILLFSNVFQLPIEIQLDESYGLTIFLIILWLIYTLIIIHDLDQKR